MDCLDNERRPHFPQFSYSASGREWTVHESDIIRSSAWYTKGPQLRTDPEWLWLDGFCPFCFSPLYLSSLLHLLFIYFLVNPCRGSFQAKIHSKPARQLYVIRAVMWSVIVSFPFKDGSITSGLLCFDMCWLLQTPKNELDGRFSWLLICRMTRRHFKSFKPTLPLPDVSQAFTNKQILRLQETLGSGFISSHK